jgi:hypothetical protein
MWLFPLIFNKEKALSDIAKSKKRKKLLYFAIHARDRDIRLAAIERLDKITVNTDEVMYSIAMSDAPLDTRIAATQRISEYSYHYIFSAILKHVKNEQFCIETVRNLKRPKSIERVIADFGRKKHIYDEALSLIKDETMLVNIVKNRYAPLGIRLYVLNRINDQDLIYNIAANIEKEDAEFLKRRDYSELNYENYPSLIKREKRCIQRIIAAAKKRLPEPLVAKLNEAAEAKEKMQQIAF